MSNNGVHHGESITSLVEQIHVDADGINAESSSNLLSTRTAGHSRADDAPQEMAAPLGCNKMHVGAPVCTDATRPTAPAPACTTTLAHTLSEKTQTECDERTALASGDATSSNERGARVPPDCAREDTDKSNPPSHVGSEMVTTRYTSVGDVTGNTTGGGLLSVVDGETRVMLSGGRAGIAVVESLLLSNRVIANPIISASMTLYTGVHAVYDYCVSTPNRLGNPTSGSDVAVRVGTELSCTAVGGAIGVGVGALLALSAVPLVGQVILSTLLSLGLGCCVSSLFTRYVDRLVVRLQIQAQYGYPSDESGARRRLEELLHTRHDLTSFDTCTVVQHYVDYRVACGWEDEQAMENYRAGIRRGGRASSNRPGDGNHHHHHHDDDNDDDDDDDDDELVRCALPVSLQHVVVVQLQRRWGFVHSRTACARVYRALMLLHHPDRGGSAAMAARLNADYALYAQCQGWEDINYAADGKEEEKEEERCKQPSPRRHVILDFLRSLIRPSSSSIAKANHLHADGVLVARSIAPHPFRSTTKSSPDSRPSGQAGDSSCPRLGRRATDTENALLGSPLDEEDSEGGSGLLPPRRRQEPHAKSHAHDGEVAMGHTTLRTHAAVKQRTVARMLEAVHRSYRNCSEAVMFGELAAAAANARRTCKSNSDGTADVHGSVGFECNTPSSCALPEPADSSHTAAARRSEQHTWAQTCRAAYRFVRLQHFLMMCSSSNATRRAVLQHHHHSAAHKSNDDDDDDDNDNDDNDGGQRDGDTATDERFAWGDENDARAQREVQRRALIAAVCTESMAHALESAAALWRSAQSLVENYFGQERQQKWAARRPDSAAWANPASRQEDAMGRWGGGAATSAVHEWDGSDATAQTLDTLIQIQRALEQRASRSATATSAWNGTAEMDLSRYVAMTQVRRIALIASWALGGLAARVTMHTAQEVCAAYFAATEQDTAPRAPDDGHAHARHDAAKTGAGACGQACGQRRCARQVRCGVGACREARIAPNRRDRHPCRACPHGAVGVCLPASSPPHEPSPYCRAQQQKKEEQSARRVRTRHEDGARVDALLHGWLEACERHYPDEAIRAPLTQLPSSCVRCVSGVAAPRWLPFERERVMDAHYRDIQPEPAIYLDASATQMADLACQRLTDADADADTDTDAEEEEEEGARRHDGGRRGSGDQEDDARRGGGGVRVQCALRRASYTDPLTGAVSCCWLKRYTLRSEWAAAAASPARRARGVVPEWVVQRLMRKELKVARGCVSDYVVAATDVLYGSDTEEKEEQSSDEDEEGSPCRERVGHGRAGGHVCAADAHDASPRGRVLYFHLPRQPTQQRFSSVHDIRQHIFRATAGVAVGRDAALGRTPVLQRALHWLYEAMTCVMELHSCHIAHTGITLGNFTFDDFDHTALGHFAPVRLRRRRGAATAAATAAALAAALAQDEVDFGAMLLAEVCPYVPRSRLREDAADDRGRHDTDGPARRGDGEGSRGARATDTRTTDRAMMLLSVILHDVAHRLIGKEEPRWSLPQARTHVRHWAHWSALEAEATPSYFVNRPGGVRYPASWRVQPNAPLAEMRVRELPGHEQLHPSVWRHREDSRARRRVTPDGGAGGRRASPTVEWHPSPCRSRSSRRSSSRSRHGATRKSSHGTVGNATARRSATRHGAHPSVSLFLNMNAALWEVYVTCRRAMNMHRRGDYTAPASLHQAPSPFLCPCRCGDEDDVNERYLWYYPAHPEELWRVCQNGFDAAAPANAPASAPERSQVTLHLYLPPPPPPPRHLSGHRDTDVGAGNAPEWALLCRVAMGTVVDDMDGGDAGGTGRGRRSSTQTAASQLADEEDTNGREANTPASASSLHRTPLETAVRRRCHLIREVGTDGAPGAPVQLIVPCPCLRCYPEYIVHIR